MSEKKEKKDNAKAHEYKSLSPGLAVGIGLVSLVCGLYMYQATMMNAMLHDYPNKGDHEYPKYEDLWIMLVSAVFFLTWE